MQASDLENRYAIVGVGGVFPDAPDLAAFWRNIVEKRVSIRKFPRDSIVSRVFWRPEVLKKPHRDDKTYTDLSGAIESFDFDPEQFRIPPAVAKHMDPNQKIALLAAQQALSSGALASVAKERVSVFMGSTMIGPLHHEFVRRFAFQRFAHHFEESHAVQALPPERRRAILDEVRERALAGTFGVTEDSAPGVLPSIIASRICSVFDLKGHAFLIDAACASGLAAVACGIQQLRLGEADAVVCGAADMGNTEEGHIYFSGIGALSPDGSFPFDARANGFVIGQGGGAVVLKRLADAIAAGDRIYALVTGYGQTSDGKGKAIAAPNEVGQALTIQRACEMGGHDADTIELYEAHGTSTQVGDRSETNAVKRAFAAMGAKGRAFCGIGSVKSNIGHLKSAAGIAGLLKAVLAIHHRWLPPTAGFERLSPAIQLEGSPFYVLTDGKAWAAKDHPRRAGVSAFGFGGANYHLALSEYREEDYRRSAPARTSTGSVRADGRNSARESAAPGEVSHSARPEPVEGRAGTAATPLWEVALFRGADPAQLLADAAELEAQLADPAIDLPALLADANARTGRSSACRLAFPVRSQADLRAKLALVRAAGPSLEALAQLQPKGVFFDAAPPRDLSQVAVLFPGQGAQYPDMLAELRGRFGAARNVHARADQRWQALAGTSVTALIDSAGDRKAAEERLRQTVHTHPAVVTASLASFAVLEQMGLRPARMIGHSLGEFTALLAAGRLSLADGLALVHARGSALGNVPADRAGGMLALPMGAAEARKLIEDANLPLTVANLNGPRQTIASGDEAAIAALAEKAAAAGIRAVKVNVSRAFHSPLMAGAQAAFAPALAEASFRPGRALVLAASTGAYYPDDAAEVVRTLGVQITSPVDFVGGIERLWADGARVFVEVGPSSILSSQTKEILADRPAVVLASDSKQGDSSEAFLRLVCQLHVAGLPIDPGAAEVVESSTARASTGSARADHEGPLTLSLSNGERDAREALRIVYSGVAAGLPGSFKDAFRDDNFEQLFEGRNLIERLTDPERQRLLDLRVSKVVKSEQGASIVELQSLNEVIQLAGRIGRLDLGKDYQLDEKELLTMSSCVAHAVAAGFEALRDAHIPLVREYVKTASGRTLPDRWALPRELQADTGVIFANGFPMVDPVIAEVSRHLASTLGNRAREAIRDFYETLIPRVTHAESRKLLADWFTLHYARLGATPREAEVYRFNHQFMTQISCQANNRLARSVNARGPNFQLNAACSSTCTAILLAEELIRGGRAKRMVVIGADDPTSAAALPYLGAGFLATGACTSEGDLYEAAVPFDRRRNGMIMGAGAVGIVVERQDECTRRGVAPVCELLGTHAFNTAGHPSSLDIPRYAEELEVFIRRMEERHGLGRAALAPDLVYFSHEPYTPPRGGCSESEAVALRHVFGERCGEIEVTNTKGMTGHTMGASLEDVVAAKALQHGRVPPIVNHREADPALAGLKLSKGGRRDVGHALRMAAGFGSQGNYVLLRRAARGEKRIEDASVHQAWLSRVSGLPDPKLVHLGRVLAIEDARPGTVLADRPVVDGRPCAKACEPGRSADSVPLAVRHAQGERTNTSARGEPVEPRANGSAPEPRVSARAEPVEARAVPEPRNGAPDAAAVRDRVLDVVAGITGYQRGMLDLDMELEADLGIDTVKQATVLATLAEGLGAADMGEVRLSDYPTLRGLVTLFTKGSGPAAGAAGPASGDASHAGGAAGHVNGAALAPTPAPQAGSSGAAAEEVAEIVRAAVADVTGYKVSLVEPSMELEADLGVDTVKQATILATLGARFGLHQDLEFRISDFPTVGHLIQFFAARAAPETARPTPEPVERSRRAEAEGPLVVSLSNHEREREKSPAPQVISARPEPVEGRADNGTPRPTDVPATLLRLLAQTTPYPPEMLELDLTLESDLGLDAATRAKLREACVREFGLPAEWQLPQDARLDELAKQIATASTPAPTAGEASSIDLARQVRALAPAPAAGPRQSLAGKTVWIWGDDEACVKALQAALQGRAKELRTLVFPSSGSPEEVLGALSPLLKRARPNVLVDTTACGSRSSLLSAAPDALAAAIARAADCRFAAWKRLADSERVPERILAVTAIDGAHGLGDAEAAIDPVFGLHAGFYKALRQEWPDRKVRIVDLAPGTLEKPAPAAFEPVVAELTERGPGVEICRIGGVRHRVVVANATIPAEPPAVLAPDEVIVATGGGAGITAIILEHLTAGRPCRVALLGRTAIDGEARRFHALPAAARPAQKDAIRERLRAAFARVTPVMVEDAYAGLERAAEILDTVARLEAAGCRVSYHAADVCDRAQLQAALEEVRRLHGPITTLLHGAGREVSRRLEKKSLDEFRSVHRAKTVGACHLGALCAADPLRRVVAISSISGLLGSAVQVDYSAANAFLDLWTRAYRRARGIRGASLVWSGWAERGMAWRNGFLREHAENAGLNFIAPEEGGRAAAREILSARPEVEVVLHRGLGGLVDPELAATPLDAAPFVDWVSHGEGRLPVVYRRFSPKRDALLDQHRLAGTPLMPGVGFMELMAEAHELVLGEDAGEAGHPYVFRQLAFKDAFKLYREAPRDVLVRSAAAEGAGGHALRMEVWSPFQSQAGGRAEERLYCTAIVSREPIAPPAGPPMRWALGGEEKTDFARLLPRPGEGHEKNVLFGPIFNDARRAGHSLAELEVTYGKDGIWTRVPLPRAQLSEPRYPLSRLRINPAFLDSLHQAGAVFCILQTGQVYLPVGAEEFAVLVPPIEEGQYDVVARVTDRGQDLFLFDIAMLRGERLCCLARNVAFRRIRQ
ncbi:MAG TPA: SDR family NAD(P)-dependent oxidoreductase [Anaeromyxobacter sp.]|nr:SDR family NAD(P)-dependent oxidoreductase [Anaeromyxobacter sp.]